jgi:hypothetical protein
MKGQPREPTTMEQLLDRICEADERKDRLSLRDVLRAIGRRSFGPLLLLAGLVTLAPVIGDIPGMPTLVGLFVALTVGQLLFGREHFWLPGWLLNRSLQRERVEKAVRVLRRPARFIDRLLRPRLQIFASQPATYAIAVMSLCVAGAMPFLEVVPFSANIAGGALAAFGLALISRDGLLALLAFGLTFTTFAMVVYSVFA